MNAKKTPKPPTSEKAPAPLAETAKKSIAVDASSDARRRASVILEVLAGVRTTVDAAEALKVTLQRYYLLEARAIEAVVLSCEPRPRGPRIQLAKEIERAREDVKRLERENARLQALLRTTERAIGVSAPRRSPPVLPGRTGAEAASSASTGATRRKRKPVVRALVAARALAGPLASGGGASKVAPPPATTPVAADSKLPL